MTTLKLKNIADANYTGESSDLKLKTFNECESAEWSHYGYEFFICMKQYEPLDYQIARNEKSFGWTLEGEGWDEPLTTGYLDISGDATNEGILTEAIRQAHAYICNNI